MKKNIAKALLLTLCAIFILASCGYDVNKNSILDEYTYKVTFIVDGETYAVSRLTAAKPSDPAKDGYNFTGWYTADGEEYTDWGAELEKNISLYASFASLWDGTTTDTDWYTAAADPSATTYTISTAAELAGLASLVNDTETGSSFAGKTITLDADIDLGGEEWTTIGVGTRRTGYQNPSDVATPDAYSFEGTFDGGGHTISNFTINYDNTNLDVADKNDDHTSCGFFGLVVGTDASNCAVVQNVTFSNATVVSDSNTAGIAVGYAENANISNVTVTNCIVTAKEGAGAVAGRIYRAGTIENCTVDTTKVTATLTKNAGGIVGCPNFYHLPSGSLIIKGNKVTLTDEYTVSAVTQGAGGISGYTWVTGFSDNTVIATSGSVSLGAESTSNLVGYLVGEWGNNGASADACTGNTYTVDGATTSIDSTFVGTSGVAVGSV